MKKKAFAMKISLRVLPPQPYSLRKLRPPHLLDFLVINLKDFHYWALVQSMSDVVCVSVAFFWRNNSWVGG